MKYKHLTDGERETLSYMRACGKSIREAAFYLNRAPSTIAREIRRNKSRARYRSHLAHRAAIDRRHQTLRRQHRFKADPQLRDRVIEWLKAGWSPEIIAGRLKREAHGKSVIHHETIYRWIYRYDRSLIKCLVRSHPRRYRRHQRRWPNRIIPRRISILQRPDFINQRKQPGHWESDLVWGSGRAALQVLVERKTRFVFIRRTRNKSAQANYDALSEALEQIPTSLRRTITYDNGSENTLHCELNDRFQLQSFFCQPYHAWEKGTVENTNGLIRRYFPKRTNFDTISVHQIEDVQRRLNNRPRKCLRFQTAGEAYSSTFRCT